MDLRKSIDHVINDEPSDFKREIETAIKEKVSTVLGGLTKHVAQNMFGESKKDEDKNGKEDDNDKDDNDDEEDSDENELKEGLRLLKTHTNKKGDKVAKVYKDTEWGEHRVKFFLNGVHQHKADHHTDDPEDAHDTAKHWLKEDVTIEQMVESNKIYPGSDKKRLIKKVLNKSADERRKDNKKWGNPTNSKNTAQEKLKLTKSQYLRKTEGPGAKYYDTSKTHKKAD